ncbi:MAG TPA: DUF3168 domain-containing protein [Rhizomicrobium sp.]|jgi:hypothetical protein|nr:DUF3168 domain-containing protein [Rhizomicrobium sp.]
MSASWALQTAIFAALSTDATLQSLVASRVFDAVPPLPTFPYIVVGDGSETNWDTATEAGSEHQLEIHIWSRANGHKQTKAIADAVRAALDNTALTLTGHTLIDLRYLDADFARETDGETRRATLRFRAVTEPE